MAGKHEFNEEKEENMFHQILILIENANKVTLVYAECQHIQSTLNTYILYIYIYIFQKEGIFHFDFLYLIIMPTYKHPFLFFWLK